MSLPIRSRNVIIPQTEDWEVHKDKICHLWYDLNKSLKQVAEIMLDEHKFYATYVNQAESHGPLFNPLGYKCDQIEQRRATCGGVRADSWYRSKMYKYRFQQWGIRKNMTAAESRQIRSQAATGGNLELPKVNGRELGPKRLKSFVASRKLRQALAHQHNSLSPRIKSPDDLHRSESMLNAAMNYSIGLCDYGLGGLVHFDPIHSESCLWYHDMLLAGTRMREGYKVAASFLLIEKSCAQYRYLLNTNDPLLLWFTYLSILGLSQVGSDIALSFARYAAELCAIELSDAHPLTILLASILRTGVGSTATCHTVVMIVEAQFDIFYSRTMSKDRFWLLYLKLMVRRLANVGMVMPEDIVPQLNTMGRWYAQIPDIGIDQFEQMLSWTQVFIAIINMTRGEHGYAVAESIFRDLEEGDGESLAFDIQKPTIVANLRHNIDKRMGQPMSAKSFYSLALAVVLTSKKSDFQRQIHLASTYTALDGFNHRRGDEKTVEMLRREYLTLSKMILDGSEDNSNSKSQQNWDDSRDPQGNTETRDMQEII